MSSTTEKPEEFQNMKTNQIRVALLGGNGFLGHNVQLELGAAGIAYSVFSRKTGCDLLNLQNARQEIKAFRPTHIVNCAAHVGSVKFVSDYAADVVDQNMRILLNIYAIAQENADVVLINPIANCGYPGTLDHYVETEFWSGPIHSSVLSYGSTRRMIDVLSECYYAQYKILSANVIVPNMYGPFDSTDPMKTHALNALVIKFLRATESGSNEVEIWGTGRPVREWLFVKDCARVICLLLQSDQDVSSPVNIAQNHGWSVDEIAQAISSKVGYKGRIVKNLSFPDGSPKKIMDDRLFKDRFPDFEFTSFESGLDATVAYYRSVL